MTSIKKLTKKTLVELANDLGISNQLSEKTDLKQDYVEKIEQFASANPGASSIISKHLQLFKAKSPTKKPTANGADTTNADTSSDEEVEAEKETEAVLDDEAVDVVKNYLKVATDKTVELYESALSTVTDTYYDVIDFAVDKSDSFREYSSSPASIGLLTTIFEFSYLYYHYIDLTTVQKSKSFPKLIKDNLPKQALKLPILDFSGLFKYSALSVFTLWSFITIVFPLITSYYINFTKPTKKAAYKYTFDPYIFTLTKFLLVLYSLKSEISFGAVQDELVYKFFGGSLLELIKAFILEGDLQIRLLFGSTTLVASAVTATIALYAVVAK